MSDDTPFPATDDPGSPVPGAEESRVRQTDGPPTDGSVPGGVVTVAREYGSGGSELARAVGRLTGWTVLEDLEVVRRVAARLGVPVRDVEARDEHVSTLAERLGASLAGVFPEILLPPDAPDVDEDRVARMAAEVLAEAGSGSDVVVVGHGGMCLFADRERAVHVRVVAPIEHRVREVSRRLDMAEDAAREEIRARDGDRAAYIRRLYDADWDDPVLYHLVLNAARVGPERGAELVRALVER